MILHLLESTRHRAWYAAPALWSTAAHGVLVLSALAGARAGADALSDPATPERVVYMLPLEPRPEPAPNAVALTWMGDGVGTRPGTAPPVPGTGTPSERGGGVRAPRQQPMASAPRDSLPITDGAYVYVAEEIDEPVERDAASAGPTYPELLRAQNVQGAVAAEWVVDTTGHADTASFRVVSSSHPLFTDAVRDVLPRMLFRPAVLSGRRVRQLVRQDFRFEISLPELARRDSTRG